MQGGLLLSSDSSVDAPLQRRFDQPAELSAADPWHRLSADAFSVLTQFLPLPDKLLHLTHVCRAFPPLTPPCFAFDTLAWTPTLITQLSASPSPPLLSLLSRVPSALFVERVDPPYASLHALCQLLSSPCPPLPFPALRRLLLQPTCTGTDDEVEPPTPLSTIVSQLPCLASLHTLRLSAELTSHDFLLLLSLALTSLDLQSSAVLVSTPPPFPFPASPLLHTLLLPALDNQSITTPPLSTLWQRALLSSLSTPQVGEEGRLERLLMPAIDACNLPYIPLLRHLHTLQLTVSSLQEPEQMVELVDFYTSLTSAPLPLRHLHMQHRQIPVRRRPLQPSGLCTALPAFVSAYASQLLTLNLLHYHSLPGEPIEPPPASVALAMTAALLSCRSLRRLQVTDWWLSPSVSAPPAPALPHLESLELDITRFMKEATLAVLLDVSPQLQELTIHTSLPPYGVLWWIGDRCHELRTLMIIESELHDPKYYAFPMQPVRLDTLRPSPALPKLTTLIFHTRRSNPGTEGYSFTRLTTYLVHSTPSLRYLHLPYHDWVEEAPGLIVMLGRLTELRGLCLGESKWMQRGQLERFWTEAGTSKRPRVQRETRSGEDSLWEDETLPRPTWLPRGQRHPERMRGGARPEVEVWAEYEELMPVFKDEADGMRGAFAFCKAIAPSADCIRRYLLASPDDVVEFESDVDIHDHRATIIGLDHRLRGISIEYDEDHRPLLCLSLEAEDDQDSYNAVKAVVAAAFRAAFHHDRVMFEHQYPLLSADFDGRGPRISWRCRLATISRAAMRKMAPLLQRTRWGRRSIPSAAIRAERTE